MTLISSLILSLWTQRLVSGHADDITFSRFWSPLPSESNRSAGDFKTGNAMMTVHLLEDFRGTAVCDSLGWLHFSAPEVKKLKL